MVWPAWLDAGSLLSIASLRRIQRHTRSTFTLKDTGWVEVAARRTRENQSQKPHALANRKHGPTPTLLAELGCATRRRLIDSTTEFKSCVVSASPDMLPALHQNSSEMMSFSGGGIS